MQGRLRGRDLCCRAVVTPLCRELQVEQTRLPLDACQTEWGKPPRSALAPTPRDDLLEGRAPVFCIRRRARVPASYDVEAALELSEQAGL